MKRTIYRFAFLSLVVVLVSACSTGENRHPTNMTNDSQNAVTIDPDSGTISVKLDRRLMCNSEVKIQNYSLGIGTSIGDRIVINYLNNLSTKADTCKEIALLTAKNNNLLQVSLSVSEVIDTVFTYSIKQSVSEKEDNVKFTGIGARIEPKSSSRNVDEELKRWLFRKKEIISDTLYSIMRNNYLYLTKVKNNDYIVIGDIPVLHQISGSKYTVSSDMKADYYAIVACNNQDFIDKYVENAVVADYKNLSKEKTSLNCTAQEITSGYLCVVLLGINKDYSYQQVPLALVAIDNEPPLKRFSIANYIEENKKKIEFKNDMKIIMPSDLPLLKGSANLQIEHWDGTGLSCRVTFGILFLGDCKSVTIQRRGTLAEYLGRSDKVIYAKDRPSSSFTWDLHFEDGDNEIPVIVEDYHGNKSTYHIIHRAEFERSNVPFIDIDNNIFN